MKQYKVGLLATLLAALAGAFTASPHKNEKQSDLYWFNPDNTIQSISTVDVATVADEEDNVCQGAGNECKDGYTSVTDLGNGNYQANGTPFKIFKQ